MWVLQKSLDLVAAKPLRDAALNYANRLSDAAYKKLPDMDVWEYIGQEREPFLQAAREELDKPTFEGGRSSGGWGARLRDGIRRARKRL